MGRGGAHLTVDSADVVITDDSPKKVAEAISISKKTSSTANLCIAISLGIKIAVFLAGTVASSLSVSIPMFAAIIADVGAAIIAVLVSLRAAR